METVENPVLLLPDVPINDLGTNNSVSPETYNNVKDPRIKQVADSLLNEDPSDNLL